ncbi:MAG: YhfC family intramembrane metalloprotease, partial [Chloroflexi bacterium]|nr:YhfC family intramembrane metalloprotease [Chloroflexota bacterium]
MLYLTFTLQILMMLGFPVALWLLLRRRPGVTWGLIVAGGLTFVGSQVVHLPLNWALGLLGGGRGVALWPLPLMALVVGLSAGVCEEVARYLVLRFWRREARSWMQGVAFGAGHGGVEVIIVGGLSLITFVSMLVLGGMDLSELGLSGEMLEQAQAQVEAFWF